MSKKDVASPPIEQLAARWVARSAESLIVLAAGLLVVLFGAISVFFPTFQVPQHLVETIIVGLLFSILVALLRREVDALRHEKLARESDLEIMRELLVLTQRIDQNQRALIALKVDLQKRLPTLLAAADGTKKHWW